MDLLKIGEFARLADTNLRTLRYYEEIGLLQPAERSDGGFRYYRATDLNRVRMIKNLQDLGMQLEAIRELMQTRANGQHRTEWIQTIRTALQSQGDLIQQRIQALKDQEARIGHALKKLNDCAPCHHVPDEKNNFCEPCQATGQTLPEFLSALF